MEKATKNPSKLKGKNPTPEFKDGILNEPMGDEERGNGN